MELRVKDNQEFKPLTIEIEIKSQDELDCINAIFGGHSMNEVCKNAFNVELPYKTIDVTAQACTKLRDALCSQFNNQEVE